MQPERRMRRSRENSASDIDVFTYLVDDDIVDPSEKSGSWEAERSRISKRATAQDDTDEFETKSVRSRLSDSGVSMNDSGYDSTSPTTYRKPRLGSLPENVFVENYGHAQRHHQFDAPTQIPPSYPQSHPSIPYPYHYDYGPPPPQNQQLLITDDPRHPTPSTIQPPISGYDLLASHLSHPTTPLPPLYRRFTHLQHRLLLQLQDEISEMESELRHLDDQDTYHRQLHDLPASRRADWASGRLDLLSKINMKLEHYHGAVLRMARVNAATKTPGEGELGLYRGYLQKERPLMEMEMRFLDDAEDLMSLDAVPMPVIRPLQRIGTPPYNFTLLSSLAGVWLLACVPSLLSRWAFLLLLAGFTIVTESSASAFFKITLTEAYGRAKDLAPPLLFWMVVMLIC
jgi:hypothetical protein